MSQATLNRPATGAGILDDISPFSVSDLEELLFRKERETVSAAIVQRLDHAKTEVENTLNSGLSYKEHAAATAILNAIEHAKRLLAEI
ncbi:hypothetical protein FHS82_003267 [Pseudochelatococcus lubricantis]|uniref:Uncharacterized protein n=2 Tax=Pseudochelatococcus lubricantis TaxID=1538102 RepID=A0ABX0V388_9HYPH|nr:EscE/YscE/SsaE family type III secretion system needle protein co-chaperone [Pseudochelatococcus lubricantis]NIJ59412.1 hypothetical protein [Pseudochelatococcus lubricantis]